MFSTVFIVHVRALFSALFSASVFISVVLGQSMNYDYILQERAVSFTQEPSSQAVLLGSTVMFNCSASVRDLPVLRRVDYNLTTFSWRHNYGQTLLAGEGSSKWRIMSTTTDSELHINDILESDSGYYECVCSDGHHNVDGEDRYIAVTVSRRASLEVIVLSTQTVELEEAVNVSLGRHLLLNCNTGASHDPRHIAWKKDGDILSTIEIAEVGVILSNKSLLIFNVTATTAGRYQCIGWYSGDAVNGTASYDVTVTNPSAAVNTVILDAPSVLGNTVALTCYLIGEEIQTVVWLKDGVQLTLGNVTKFASTIQITTADSGVYTCKIMGSDIQASTTIISPPRITGDGRVREDISELATDLEHVPFVKMNCELSVSTSPSTVIYWYKDGENVTDYYNSTTGELKYVVDRHEVDNLFGVYQCFAENSAGVDYTITRVLPLGFSNPPGNFTCIAVDQDNNEDNPKFILNWDRPTLLPGVPPNTVTSYQLSVESSGNHLGTYVNIRTSDYIFDDFDVDGNYKFTVFVMTSTDRGGAKATCVVADSLIERRERVVRELDVSCPAELDQPIVVKWVNPGVYILHIGSNLLLEPVVNFISVCLYANRSLDPSEDYLDYADERLFDVETVMLSTVDPVPGAVCLFGGYYKLSDSEFSDRMDFTPVTCSFPAYEPTAAVQLRVSCSDSVAEVEWWSSSVVNTTNVSVQGRCISPTWDQHSLNVSALHDGESASITGLPDSSVCTFYGSYEAESGETKSLDPIQCIMGQNIIPQTYPMTNEPEITLEQTTDGLIPSTQLPLTTIPPYTYPTTNKPHQTTTDGLQRNKIMVVYPVVVSVLVVTNIITASMVVVCCVLHYVRGMKQQYKRPFLRMAWEKDEAKSRHKDFTTVKIKTHIL